jgi:peptidoglycan/LPS O-acetylase OafA/YrhL
MLSYRPDIDGLRALAVLSVILFHAGVPGFSGGFVGVDVFFVLSGFLITSIIAGELSERRFSLVTFYERRLRRIAPPLLVMLLATALVGTLLLLPAQLEALGESLWAALGFVSNVYFHAQAGYFAPAAETQALLHTWSLAVEEQFYLLFPPLLALAVRRGRAAHGVLAVLLVSLACSISGLWVAREATFFLAHARAFELLIGALVALTRWGAPSQRLRELLSALGLCAIVGAVVGFGPRTPFPGLYALVPCLGTAALVYAGATGTSLVTRLLSMRWPVRIGLVSYGLYLWHWPLLVYARQWHIRPLGAGQVLLALAFTCVLTIASYFLIERPIRQRRVLRTPRALFVATGGAGLVLCVLAGVLVLGRGLPARVPARVHALEQQGTMTTASILERHCAKRTSERERCIVGSKGREAPSFALWGDSHAGTLVPLMARLADAQQRRGAVHTRVSCAPLLEVGLVDEGGGACTRFNRRVVDQLAGARALRHVFLSARWAYWVEGSRYGHELGRARVLEDAASTRVAQSLNPQVFERGMRRTIERLHAAHKRVSIVLGWPEIGYPTASALARIVWWERALDIRPTRAQYEQRQARTLAIFRGLRKRYGIALLNPAKVLCAAPHCAVERDDKLVYRDDDHLTRAGAMLLAPLLARELEKSRAPDAAPAPQP